jgi:2-hydroxycyclohexanecarboxyl-CoA dehydrogenase
MDLGLAGKVVIVPGAAANIGRAIALDFASEGIKLIAGPRRESGSPLAGLIASPAVESAASRKARVQRHAAIDEQGRARQRS